MSLYDNRTPEILIFIVNHGMGKKVLKSGKEHDIQGATVFLGRGSKNYRKRWLESLDLTESRKEIVMMLAMKETINEAIGPMTERFRLEKPHHGIAFRMPISGIYGSGQFKDAKEEKGGRSPVYKAIFVIVDRGNAEDVIEAACEAGQKGGTILKARGAGVHETQKLFKMEIAPEKEVVILLAKAENADRVTTSIRKKLDIDEAGNGLIFLQDVKEAYGLLSRD